MNRERVIKVVEEELTKLGIDNVEPENAYSKGYKVSHILADRIIAEEGKIEYCTCKHPLLAEADKPTFHKCYSCCKFIKPQQPKLPEKLDATTDRIDIIGTINSILDYLKAREV